MAYNSPNRSERLLQGRRFTTNGLTLTQEAFTDVFDLGANEIFTDDGLIPTGSSQLPYSGSSQDGLIISASLVDPTTYTEGSTDDLAIVKFHHRKKLKGAADATREIYYFTTSDPSSHDDYVTSDQIIEADQQTNFVSPKYIIPEHASRNAESITPGYKVAISYGNDENSVTAATDDQFVFDYKTGVLTWIGTPPHDGNDFVFITAYQYVGRTLRTQIDDGTLGGSGFPFSGSAVITGSLTVSASKVDFTNATAISGSTFSGSFVGDGSGLTGLTVDTNTVNLGGVLGGTANNATFADNVLSGSGADNQVAIFNGASELDGSSNLTFDGQTLTVSTASITTNLTVGGNLTVQGTTTTIDSTQIELGDRILVLNAALGGGSGNAGINVHVSASDGDPAAHTGSFLWDDDEKYWKGGELGSEVKFLTTTDSSSFATRATTNEGNISTNGSNITALQTDSGSFSTRVTTNESNITNLQTDSGSFSTRITTNEGDISTNGSNITALQTDSGSFSTRVTTNETDITSLQTDSGSFSTRVTTNETDITNLQTDSGSFSTRVTTNETDITSLQTDSGSFSTRVTDNENNITSLQTDSGSFSTRVTTNEGSISTNETDITNLQTDSGSFSTRVTTNEGNITNLQTDSGSFSTRVTTNEGNITNLQTDSGSFSTRVTSNESAITTLQGNETHTAAAISGAIDAATGSLFNGTPLNNQIAVFTDHNTIEGDSNFTWDGTTLTLGNSKNLTVGGNLTISGTTTTVNSTEVEIGDNIIILNSAEAAANAGIHVFDADSTGITGSLVYDYASNYWIAGTKDSEKRIVTFTVDNPANDSFIHLNDSDEVVAIASGSTVGAFLQKTANGFEVSAVIDGGTY